MDGANTIQACTYEHHSSFPEATKGEKQPPKFNDIFWSIFFFFHLCVMTFCAITYIPQFENEVRDGLEKYYDYDYKYVNNNGDGERKLWTLFNQGNDVEDGATLASMFMRNTGMAYVTISDYFHGKADESRDLEESTYYEEVNANGIFIVITIAIVTGIFFSTLSLTLLMKFAEPLIKGTLLMNVFIGAAMALFGFIKGMPEFIMLGVLVFTFASCYAYFVWHRIPFAAANLVTATTSIRANIGVTIFAWIAIILGGLWLIFWSLTSYSTVFIISKCDVSGYCQNDINAMIVFLLLISLYWTQQIISNVVRVTVAGTVGTWWWAPHEASSCCSDGVRSSYHRAMTYSFGSICLGSLLVAIVQAMKTMLEKARESDDGLLLCIADCLIGCLESILEMFNQWAFVYVGLYGYPFMEAASNVMTLFKARGWTVIITDYMIDRVLDLVSFGIGVLIGGVAALVSYLMKLDIEELSFFIGLIIGMILTAVLLGVVGSAVNTIIVCYAEDPATFDVNHFELSTRMRESWRNEFPNDFRY